MKYLIEDLGEIYLTKLTPEQVKRFYSKKLADGLSTKTVHCLHGLLHNALETAESWGYVSRNVCELIKPPKVTTRQGTPLTVEQAKQLLEQVKEHRLEVLLTMAIVTGMRRGELLALKWSNIDLERRVLVVVATVDFVPKYGFIENKPKTKAGQRAIYLPPFLVEMLREHKAKQDKRRQEIGANWEDRNLVFPNTHGGYWYPSAMCRLFAKMLEQAGLPPIHFHDLRHSAATILLSMGVNIKIIQELLGHSNVSITLGTYSHLLPTMQQVSAATMSDLFGEK